MNGFHNACGVASGLSSNALSHRTVFVVVVVVGNQRLISSSRRLTPAAAAADCTNDGSSSCRLTPASADCTSCSLTSANCTNDGSGSRRCRRSNCRGRSRVKDEHLMIDERAVGRFGHVGGRGRRHVKGGASSRVSVKHWRRCAKLLSNGGLVRGDGRVVGDRGSGKVIGVRREVAVVEAQAAHEEATDGKELPGKGKLNGGLVGLHPTLQHDNLFFGSQLLQAGEVAFFLAVAVPVVVPAASALSSSLSLDPRRRWHGRSSSS